VSARRHRVLVRVLLATAVVVAFVATFSLWANRQALDTDNWTDTSGKLLADHHVQQAVGTFLVDQLFANVDVSGQIQALLPKQAAALAGPAAGGLHELATRAAPRILASPRVQDAWRAANRAAHRQLVAVVEGGNGNVSIQNGEVVLNLRPLVQELATDVGLSSEQVAAAGSKARGVAQQRLGVTLPPASGQLVIMRSDQLETVQTVGNGIRHLALLATILMLVLFALAIWLAHGWRRVALRSTGWCFIGVGLFVLLARRFVGNRVVDGLVASDSVKPAAHSTWTIGTSLLYDIAIAAVVYGVVIVLSAWLAGPTRSAVTVRRLLAPRLEHNPGMVYGAVALVYLLVLLWGPTPATRKAWGIILLGALIVLGLELLRRQVAREFPDAQPGDARGWLRERYAAVRGRRAPVESDEDRRVDELERLASLHDRGVLTDAEFAAEKVLLLDGGGG